MTRSTPIRFALGAACLALTTAGAVAQFAKLEPATSVEGYVARLLINETPFPGERGFVSVSDSEAAMLAILYVLESRLKHIPAGYTQQQIAATRADDVIDIITAGGAKGQCDGFSRNAAGKPTTVPRVEKRITYLLQIANDGDKPGRFAELLNFAQNLTRVYVRQGIVKADRFAALRNVGPVTVTGRAYSWMTGMDYYHPGGDFVKIPDAQQGLLGGNRFFTLETRK